MEYKCNDCKKFYSSYQCLWIHNKKFHSISNRTSSSLNSKSSHTSYTVFDNINEIKCDRCLMNFTRKDNLKRHQLKCIKIKEHNEKIQIKLKELDIAKMKEENKNLELQIKLKNNNEIVPLNNTDNSELLNNQLINIIVDKTKTIEELQTKIDIKEENKLVDITKEKPTLNLNNVVIVSRSEDNYINATQLCQAGGKRFYDWLRLDITKELVNVLETKIKNETAPETGITASVTHSLIEINKGGNDKNNQFTWIHPDLAIQLAQWISPIFALQVSEWIRTLFTTGTVSVDIKLLEDKEKEIKLKDQKIQLLENTYNKKQKRENYPNNIIYMLTTKENKKDRIYIIGKATILKDRLSGYNKTAEHEVVYYKQCNRKSLITIEKMILTKLEIYREKANRDRFILPVGKEISLFTDIIDSCVKFIDDKEIDL